MRVCFPLVSGSPLSLFPHLPRPPHHTIVADSLAITSAVVATEKEDEFFALEDSDDEELAMAELVLASPSWDYGFCVVRRHQGKHLNPMDTDEAARSKPSKPPKNITADETTRVQAGQPSPAFPPM